jgi:predicted DNA-binding ribbon-helix-helix protein
LFSALLEHRKGAGLMKSMVVKRSVVLAGHKTSISLEEPFWEGLKDIARRRKQSLSDVIGSIDAERTFGNLSSAVRLFVLNHYQEESAERAAQASDCLANLSP